MNRPTRAAQADFCDSCGAAVITTSLDVLGDVMADIVADPTVLNQQQMIACVVLGRAMYRIERTNGVTYLGIKHSGTDQRRMAGPDDVLARHQCGKVFPGSPTTAFTSLLDIRTAYEELDIPF